MKSFLKFSFLTILIILFEIGFVFAQSNSTTNDIEKKFDSYLKASDLKARLEKLSARPHHVGSPYDKENAEYILSLYKSWGWDAHIETFYVLFPTPKTRILEMISPEKFAPLLKEPALKEDRTSDQKDEQLPTYNAYSIDGDVTGELVYVNYGIPSDYEQLEKMGISVEGKIVIARYGAAWRGIKPKVAAEHGAIGCIMYSDPRNDGFYVGDVYPEGSWRNEYGVQRGSVADMPVYSGDPSTPFVGATKDAKHLDVKDIKILTKIPVMPISYHDALPMLKNLTGPVVPNSWKGALPITYHVGPGPAKVHLKLEFNWDIKPIYDVIAKIKGSVYPDEWVIRGNHHDGWVNGAEDPLSGQVAMLEEAKALGELHKNGWSPKRTLIYCSWDGEEPGLLGSTEWVETHADELKQKAVVYINSDSNGRGFLYAEASHTLQTFINDVAKDITDPEKGISVRERLKARRILNASTVESKKEIENSDEFPVGALGSGSDYTPFLQHLGIASMNIGYGGEDEGGVYHSIYDSYDHYIRFGDPTFEYGVTLAKTGGRIMMRLADAEILPFNFPGFSNTVSGYLDEIVKMTDKMRKETEQLNYEITHNLFEKVSDPTKTSIAPKPESEVPHLNFSSLENATTQLKKVAEKFGIAKSQFLSSGKKLTQDQEKKLNEIIYLSERALTNKDGLDGRPWFVHEIYAPGFYTGYGVKTLPAVREAVESRNWDEANKQAEVVAGVINNYASQINRAASLLASFTN
ncbi:MAG TPA: M28 family metallopeptidase [Ignavibacteriaceae bacterium]|nr:M28 family metallopeptidase [Ignavibacteriaceae bacterium]